MILPIRRWLSLLLIVSASFVVVLGQEQQAQQQPQKYTLHQLQMMTDEELESICLQRGFELVKDEIDEETGEPIQLTHDDFVEAAQRCIAIEEEMNEILAQHPELAEELDEEIARMQQEKEEKEAEIEQLQADLKSQEKEAKATSSSEKEKPAAFIPKASPSEEEKVGSPQPNQNAESKSSDDFEISEEEPANSQSGKEAHSRFRGGAGTKGESDDDGEDEPFGSELSQEEKPTGPEDFTISALSTEIIRKLFQNAERDLKRIVDIVLPVVQPMLKAGDVAWQQLKRTFHFIKQDLAKRREAKNEDQDESGDNAAEETFN